MKRSGTPLIRILFIAAIALTILLVLGVIFTPQLLTLKGTSATLAGDDWPTYLHDAQRTGTSNETILTPENVGHLTRLWTFPTGGGIATSASIVKGTAYFGSWDGFEYSVDAVKGYLKWKTYLGRTTARCVPPTTGITSAAAVVNNVVYVGGGDSYWYALDAFTGAVLWKVFTGSNNPNAGYYNWSSPLIYQGFAYIGIASDCDNPLTQGTLLKVSLQTHTIVKTFKVVSDGEVGGGIWTSPAIDPATNTIYVTTGTRDSIDQTLSQAILALDATTMTLKSSWQIPLDQSGTDDDWGTTPNLFVTQNGHKLVEASNKNGFTYAFNAANLSAGPVWEQQTEIGGTCPACGDGTVASAVLGNGLLYAAGGKTVINGTAYMGVIRGINPATGQYVWEHGELNAVIAALAYVNGMVIASEGNDVEVLDAKTGERLYNYETGAGMYAAASVSHGQIFVGSLDGSLYAFGLAPSSDPPSDAQCPGPWLCQDIGDPRTNGSETLSGNQWNVLANGSGLANISDQFRFINQPASGNIQVSADISSQQAKGTDAQAALMFRQSLAAGSPFYAASRSPSGKLTVEYRTAFNGAIVVIGSLPQIAPGSFLEIQRVGDEFRAAVSSDGQRYTLVPGSTVDLPFPFRVYAGLAASSGINGTPGQTVYKDVTLGTSRGEPVAPNTPSPCPANWNCGDIGNPALVGDQTTGQDELAIKGSGLDIWGVEDQFHYVWQSMANNTMLSVQLLNEGNADAQAKAGVMLRASTEANAPYYAAFITPGQGLVIQYRSLPGLDTKYFVNDSSIKTPTYLRVARWNNIFTTYTSPDGLDWTAVDGSSIVIDIGASILTGLAVTSHKPAALNTATFGPIKVSADVPPAPTACPKGWHCVDVGYPAPAGSQIYNVTSGVWTISGGGYDIYLQQDQFHYVWQPLKGNGTLDAQIISQTNTNPSAKSGVMLRASADISSPYYAVVATPGDGIIAQFRTKKGGNTQQIFLPKTYKAPIYLRIVRSGNTFTAYTSQDEVTWTPIPGSSETINMGSTVLAGLAVNSHNISYPGVVTFDGVRITAG